MKRTRKWIVFTVALLVLVLAATGFAVLKARQNAERARAEEIRNNRRNSLSAEEPGSVSVTFSPSDNYDANETEMLAAEAVIKMRLISRDITGYKINTDASGRRIFVRFPWKQPDPDFDPEQVIRELGATAFMTFREGCETDELGRPAGVTADNVILDGNDITSASAVFMPANADGNNVPVVSLEFSSEGSEKFSEATGRLVGQVISIWMDDTILSSPIVNAQISDGQAVISGNFTIDEAKELADKINAGALPFRLQVDGYNIVPPASGASVVDNGN